MADHSVHGNQILSFYRSKRIGVFTDISCRCKISNGTGAMHFSNTFRQSKQ